MKILVVLTYYRPHWTGLTQYAARLAEGLAKRGHQVEVLCSRHEKNLPLKEKIGGVIVFRTPFLFKFLRSVFMPSFLFELWKRVRQNEVVVVYLPLQEVLLVAAAVRILNKKLFLVHNGDLVLPEGGGVIYRLIEKVYYWTTGLAIRFSKKIIVQTKDYSEKSLLLSRHKDKWAVILPLYQVTKKNEEAIKEFKKKYCLEKKILIGFSGRFVEEKGVEYLLRTVPAVVRLIPRAHFVFAGDYQIKYEKYWDKIQGLVKENQKHITLVGLLKEQREISAFYRSLSVYVQPSRTDCFPSSLVEALLSGVPSVCTDIPGTRWVVKQTGMGLVVKSRNSRSLEKGIIKLLVNKEKYLRYHWKVKAVFDNQRTLKNYEKLFKKN